MDTHVVTDEELAGTIARRDESPAATTAGRDACRELYERHGRKLLAFLAGRVKPALVEDIAQDTWQKVWQSLPTAFRGGNFRSWLYTIARNCMTDQLRRKKAEGLTEESTLADSRLRPPDEELAELELRDALSRCLQKLEQLDAGLAELVRCRVAGESYEDICARIGMPADRAYRAFHHAKTQLLACVDKKVSP